MKRYRIGLVAGALVLLAGAAQAAIVNVTLNSAVLSGLPGSGLTFNGTLTNTSGATVFLNAAGINLAGFSPANEDTGPFFTNAPLFLAAGASSPAVNLFTVNVPNPFAGGSYQGTFTVLGGADANAQNTVGSASFTVQVNSPGSSIPEPGSATLLFLGAAALGWRRFSVRSS